MNRSRNAKLALWASLIAPIYPKLDCGTYVVSGKLDYSPIGHYRLTLNDKSTSRFELLLLGGSFDERWRGERQRVKMEVYIPREIKDHNEPFVFFQKLLDERPKLSDVDNLKLMKKEACNLKEKFR